MTDGEDMSEKSGPAGVEGSKSEKLAELGRLCASLGLQPNRMTEGMLSTIELSKDIERSQRTVIERLSSTSPRMGDDEVEQAGQSIVVEDDKDSEMQLNTVGKSLKRKRIPPPLTISDTDSTTASLHGSGRGSGVTYRPDGDASFARSAPAHVTNFPHSSVERRFSTVGKPKVQYLGKIASGGPQSRSPIQATNAYKLKTPYAGYFPRYSVPPPVPTSYPPYYPCMYPGQLPLYQSTSQHLYNPPVVPHWQPRSAVPYSSQARSYPDGSVRAKRSRPQAKPQTKKPKSNETDKSGQATIPKDLENSGSVDRQDSEQAENEEDQENTNDSDDTESAHLAIEENPRPFPSSEPRGPNVLGEIRISGNVFSYEFPSNRPGIDKKMFMSICDKVWDESRRFLDDNAP